MTSNQHAGDVVNATTTSTAGPWVKEQSGWSAPYAPENVQSLVPTAVGKDGLWFAAIATANGLVYSSDSLSADEVPSEWDQLVDESWRNGIAPGDPTRAILTTVILAALWSDGTIDEQWYRDLHGLNPRPSDTPQVEQLLSSGLNDIGFWGMQSRPRPGTTVPRASSSPGSAVQSLNGAALLNAHRTRRPQRCSGLAPVGRRPAIDQRRRHASSGGGGATAQGA